MPHFINHNKYSVDLIGPNGETVRLASGQKRELPEYYNRYCARGFIRPISENVNVIQSTPPPSVPSPPTGIRPPQRQSAQVPKNILKHPTRDRMARHLQARPKAKPPARQNVVGRQVVNDSVQLLQNDMARSSYPISNGVGIGVLSYNRGGCLRRLIDSIVRYTDLKRTTVFVSDDGSTDQATLDYLDELSYNQNIVVLRNTDRLGIAGNTNRLLKCLSRFRYGMLLNDDVEILSDGWDRVYFDAMAKTSMHHFIYREPGVYGAQRGESKYINEVAVNVVNDRPHGAVLAFTSPMLARVGHFDERYGVYGMEHVDWSRKAWEFNLQPPGFYDIDGSHRYFKIHKEESAVENRVEHLKRANEQFARRTGEKFLSAVEVPSVSYVIPFRDFERSQSIVTVIDNIRAHKFPVIEIVAVEQDASTKIDVMAISPAAYKLATYPDPLFNKSVAFNLGVQASSHEYIIMHDADMLMQGDYTTAVYDALQDYESCHLGSKVLYTTRESAQEINDSHAVSVRTECDRVVGYFEGGSLACTKAAYWKVGGFNEDYKGYGCEDCDFYARLSGGSNWLERRTYNLLHLWHSRTAGWEEHHNANKAIETRLRALSIQDRIALQRSKLAQWGYDVR